MITIANVKLIIFISTSDGHWSYRHGGSSWITYFDWSFTFGFQEYDLKGADPTHAIRYYCTPMANSHAAIPFFLKKKEKTQCYQDYKLPVWDGSLRVCNASLLKIIDGTIARYNIIPDHAIIGTQFLSFLFFCF